MRSTEHGDGTTTPTELCHEEVLLRCGVWNKTQDCEKICLVDV